MLKIPHDAYLFVGDGRKALFLRKEGDTKFPNLKTENVFEEENPATRDQGSDRPGRFAEAVAVGRRSAVEPTDWHDLEEHRFARKVATAFEKIVREKKTKSIILVAPPRTLAELRKVLHPDVKACIVEEINKDLTKHPVGEIEKLLFNRA